MKHALIFALDWLHEHFDPRHGRSPDEPSCLWLGSHSWWDA